MSTFEEIHDRLMTAAGDRADKKARYRMNKKVLSYPITKLDLVRLIVQEGYNISELLPLIDRSQLTYEWRSAVDGASIALTCTRGDADTVDRLDAAADWISAQILRKAGRQRGASESGVEA